MMNEISLIDDILQRSREKKTLELNRNELGSLMALLKLTNYQRFDNDLMIGMMNEQMGKLLIRFMQKLMNYRDKYSITVSATERYVIANALSSINQNLVGVYESTLITNLILKLY